MPVMAEEISLVREYEAIIRAMKEQIAVLKARLGTKSGNRSFESDQGRGGFAQKVQEADALSVELRAANELISRLSSEKLSLERKLDTSLTYSKDQSSLQTKLRTSEHARSQLHSNLAQARSRVETLAKENLVLRRSLDESRAEIDPGILKYEDLNTTQRARYMIMERKIRIIETENRVLTEKIATTEAERRQLADKYESLVGKFKDFEALKVQLKDLSEDLRKKDLIIARLSEQSADTQEVSMERLGDYKAQIQASRTHASPKAQSSDHTDSRLLEMAKQLRKTQAEVAEMKKTGLQGSRTERELSPRGGTSLNASLESSPSALRSPAARAGVLVTISEQVKPGAKKPGLFRPTSSRAQSGEPGYRAGQTVSLLHLRSKLKGV